MEALTFRRAGRDPSPTRTASSGRSWPQAPQSASILNTAGTSFQKTVNYAHRNPCHDSARDQFLRRWVVGEAVAKAAGVPLSAFKCRGSPALSLSAMTLWHVLRRRSPLLSRP
jgi:hypothetical protein